MTDPALATQIRALLNVRHTAAVVFIRNLAVHHDRTQDPRSSP